MVRQETSTARVEYAAVAILALAACSGTILWGGWIFDALPYVRDHPQLQEGRGLLNLWNPWDEQNVDPVWMPLTLSLYWLEHRLFGTGWTHGWHATSALLHATNAVLALAWCRQAGLRWGWAGVALWAVHTGALEATGTIYGAKDMFAATWVLAGGLALMHGHVRSAGLALALGVLSKPTAGLAIVAWPILLWAAGKTLERRQLAWMAGPALLAAIPGMTRYWGSPSHDNPVSGWTDRMCTMAEGPWGHLRHTVDLWVSPFGFHPAGEVICGTETALAAVALAGVGWCCVWSYRKGHRWVVAGCSTWLLWILVHSGGMPNGNLVLSTVFGHLRYGVALIVWIGIASATGMAVQRTSGLWRRPAVRWTTAAGVLGVMSGLAGSVYWSQITSSPAAFDIHQAEVGENRERWGLAERTARWKADDPAWQEYVAERIGRKGKDEALWLWTRLSMEEALGEPPGPQAWDALALRMTSEAEAYPATAERRRKKIRKSTLRSPARLEAYLVAWQAAIRWEGAGLPERGEGWRRTMVRLRDAPRDEIWWGSMGNRTVIIRPHEVEE